MQFWLIEPVCRKILAIQKGWGMSVGGIQSSFRRLRLLADKRRTHRQRHDVAGDKNQ